MAGSIQVVTQAAHPIRRQGMTPTINPGDVANGIGLRLEIQGDFPVVKEVATGSPADKATDVKAGDQIVAIGDGMVGPMTNMEKRPLYEVLCFLLGKRGVPVRLLVSSRDDDTPRTVTANRTHWQDGLDEDGTPVRHRFRWRKTNRMTFVDTYTVQRFPGSVRFYELQTNQMELKAEPERFDGKRVALVTQLLFPGLRDDPRRIELRMFGDMRSPVAVVYSDAPIFKHVVRNNPKNGDMVVTHVVLRKYADTGGLYGELEEILFPDPEKPDAGKFLGVPSVSISHGTKRQ